MLCFSLLLRVKLQSGLARPLLNFNHCLGVRNQISGLWVDNHSRNGQLLVSESFPFVDSCLLFKSSLPLLRFQLLFEITTLLHLVLTFDASFVLGFLFFKLLLFPLERLFALVFLEGLNEFISCLSLAIQALSTRSLNEFLAQQAVRACAVRACDQFALATAGEAQIRAKINASSRGFLGDSVLRTLIWNSLCNLDKCLLNVHLVLFGPKCIASVASSQVCIGVDRDVDTVDFRWLSGRVLVEGGEVVVFVAAQVVFGDVGNTLLSECVRSLIDFLIFYRLTGLCAERVHLIFV